MEQGGSHYTGQLKGHGLCGELRARAFCSHAFRCFCRARLSTVLFWFCILPGLSRQRRGGGWGGASLISASLLEGLASFDSPIYLCQEFSFEFLPACLSMIFCVKWRRSGGGGGENKFSSFWDSSFSFSIFIFFFPHDSGLLLISFLGFSTRSYLSLLLSLALRGFLIFFFFLSPFLYSVLQKSFGSISSFSWYLLNMKLSVIGWF